MKTNNLNSIISRDLIERDQIEEYMVKSIENTKTKKNIVRQDELDYFLKGYFKNDNEEW